MSGPDPRWLVTGASGQLGGNLLTRLAEADIGESLGLCGRRNPPPFARSRVVDLNDLNGLHRAVVDFRPTYVVHTSAMTAVADCHADPHAAQRCNVDATRVLCDAAADCGARFLFTSTDMVFSGESAPYREDNEPTPLSVYGRTKVEAERHVREYSRALVVRLPLLFGLPATPRETTFTRQLDALRKREPLKLFVDEFRTPVSLREACRALVGLAKSERSGLIHAGGPARMSRLDLLQRAAELLNLPLDSVIPISRLTVPAAEPRPRDLSLASDKLSCEFPDLLPGPMCLEDLVPRERGDNPG